MDSSTGPVRNDASIRSHAVRRIRPRSGKDDRSGRDFEQELGGSGRKRRALERDDEEERQSKRAPRPAEDDEVGGNIDVTG